jgi:hypothetical protein
MRRLFAPSRLLALAGLVGLFFACAVLLSACDGTITDNRVVVDTPTVPTGVAVAVTYRGDSVVSLSVTGLVNATTRKFGPYTESVDKVPSGGSIGLVFDPDEQGTGMTCISSIQDNGLVRDSDCTNFDIKPSTITHASIRLE